MYYILNIELVNAYECQSLKNVTLLYKYLKFNVIIKIFTLIFKICIILNIIVLIIIFRHLF